MSTPEEPASQQPNNQDFVIREGFPALRTPNGKPWLDGEEPLPKAPLSVFPDALQIISETKTSSSSTSDVWETLYEDCRTVFSARTRDDDQAYSAGVTYFLPSVMKPRCALESIVYSIFQAHTACLPKGSLIPEQSGAEWWTLVMDDANNKEKTITMSNGENDEKELEAAAAAAAAAKSSEKDGEDNEEEDEEEDSDEVGLHFDADHGLEDQVTNLFLHPRVATVTYLTSHGAPTVVLDRRSPPQGDMETLNGPIRRGWLCHPNRGRHLAFDGRLLHGAPATFFPAHAKESAIGGGDDDDDDTKPPPTKKVKVDGNDEKEASENSNHRQVPRAQRITLLVNVWVNHCPLDAEPLEDDICAKLKTPADTLAFSPTLPDRISLDNTPVVQLLTSGDDPAGEEEVVIGNRIVTAHYSPSMDDLHAASTNGSIVSMEFVKDAVRLVVGEMAPQEEDDEDGVNDGDAV